MCVCERTCVRACVRVCVVYSILEEAVGRGTVKERQERDNDARENELGTIE